MATSPAPAICIERERLIRLFLRSVQELNRVQIARASALLAGDENSFAEQIAEAERAMSNAEYGVLAHREEHGC